MTECLYCRSSGNGGDLNDKKRSLLPLSDFSAVDTNDNPKKLIKYLEKSNLAPLAKFSRMHLIHILQPRVGDHILEIGCGIGYTAQALAKKVGTSGRVIAIDSSSTMIHESLKRARPLPRNLEFHLGDAHVLPFKRERFDACISVSTFIHLASPRKALKEIFRVLRPEGRLAILEPDWDTFVIEVGDAHLSEKVIRVIRGSVPNSGIGHQLPIRLRQSGMKVVSVDAATLLASDFLSANDAWRIEASLQRAAISGILSSVDVQKTMKQLKLASRCGSFFAASTGFAVIAIKPSSGDE